MPRIRTVKPEFWQDEKLASLDPLTRLVFLGLISMADDAGRLVDNVKLIDGFLFPETADTSRDPLDTLARSSRICRYISASGQRLIQISNWERHQKVDHPNKYTLPAPTPKDLAPKELPVSSRVSRENVATISRDPLATTNDQRSTTNDQLLVAGATNGARVTRHQHSSRAPPAEPNWVNEAVEIYAAHIGVLTHGMAGRLLKPVVVRRGWPEVKQVLECFCELAPYVDYLNRAESQTLRPGEEKVKKLGYNTKLSTFVEQYTHWQSHLQVGS
jgi:hypothetical protein